MDFVVRLFVIPSIFIVGFAIYAGVFFGLSSEPVRHIVAAVLAVASMLWLAHRVAKHLDERTPQL